MQVRVYNLSKMVAELTKERDDARAQQLEGGGMSGMAPSGRVGSAGPPIQIPIGGLSALKADGGGGGGGLLSPPQQRRMKHGKTEWQVSGARPSRRGGGCRRGDLGRRCAGCLCQGAAAKPPWGAKLTAQHFAHRHVGHCRILQDATSVHAASVTAARRPLLTS